MRNPPQVPQNIRNSLVGRTALYPADATEPMKFTVVIQDVKNRWGHIDALIAPSHGLGEKWVDSRRLIVGE